METTEKKKHKSGFALLKEKLAKAEAENKELRRKFNEERERYNFTQEECDRKDKRLTEEIVRANEAEYTIEQQSRKISQLTTDLHISETLRLNPRARLHPVPGLCGETRAVQIRLHQVHELVLLDSGHCLFALGSMEDMRASAYDQRMDDHRQRNLKNLQVLLSKPPRIFSYHQINLKNSKLYEGYRHDRKHHI